MKLPHISAPNEIPNEQYHSGEEYRDYVSSSVLKNIMHSPLWMRYCQDNPEDDEPTKSWKLEGNSYHGMLASIANTGDLSEFEQQSVVFDPPINEKTGEPYGYTSAKFKDAYAQCVAENPGKEIYSRTEISNSEAMVKQLRFGNPHLSPIINAFLKIGKAEISIFCKHEDNDLIQYDSGLFKIRPDLMTSKKIIDWKTVSRATGDHAPIRTEDFAKVISKRMYGFSIAMYQYFTWLVTGKWKSGYWVVQDKQPPYDFNLISADGWAFEVSQGQMVGIGEHARVFIRALEQYLYCLERDQWPGVSVFTKPDYRGQRVAYSKVPGWELNKNNEFFN